MAEMDPKTMNFIKGFKADLNTARIVADKGRTVVMVFDGEYQGRQLFNVREFYQEYGEWKPGKGIALPIERRDDFLREMALYAALVGAIKGMTP